MFKINVGMLLKIGKSGFGMDRVWIAIKIMRKLIIEGPSNGKFDSFSAVVEVIVSQKTCDY